MLLFCLFCLLDHGNFMDLLKLLTLTVQNAMIWVWISERLGGFLEGEARLLFFVG